MPYDGSGNYSPAAAPNFPAISGEVILASRYNAVINDISMALSNVLTRDGQGRPLADISWNAKNLTNVTTLGAVTGNFSGTVTAASVTVSGTLTVAALALTTALPVASGGTGVATLLNNRLVRAKGSGAFEASRVTDSGSGAINLGGSTDIAGTLGVSLNLNIGADVGAGFAAIELGGSRAAAGIATLDLHSTVGADYDFRLIRASGANGASSFLHRGTGTLSFTAENAGAVAFQTNGAERVRITSAGAVGIGTTSPQGLLDVRGDLHVGAQLLTGTGVTTGAAVIEHGANRTNEGSAAFDFHTQVGQDFNCRLRRNPGANGSFEVINQGTGSITVLTGGFERMRVTDLGRVGIGTETPVTILDIGTGTLTGKRYASPTLANSFIDLTDAVGGAPGISFDSTDSLTYDRTGNNLVMAIGAATVLTVNANGVFDSVGNVRRLVKASATSGVLTAASAQRIVRATGGCTINNSVFAADDSIMFINKSGGAITLTQGTGMVLTDPNGATGNRTLASNGVCTVWFNTASDAHIFGTGLT